ncbi:MAG: Glu/Leu/Phe/Val family dehydrogenase [Candidatus Amoebophilus sp.]
MKIIESVLPQGQGNMPLESIITNKHEKVIYHYDEATGLKAIVAIHNTILGPGLGGARIWDYAHEEHALVDALRLSKGMTYKSAVAGLDLGGAKAVIIGDVNKLKNEAYLRKYGQFVESLHGSYITAPDVNTTMYDMVHIAKETKYIVGLPAVYQGSGDPSILTAYGTYMGIKAVAQKAYGSDSLAGKKIGIQGVGKVGAMLVDHLTKEGASIYITDILPGRLAAIAKEYNVQVIQDAEAFYELDMDIYAPCALGATINDQTIAKLKCQAIAGAANNQLADEHKHGRMLLEKGIIYAPDFLVNAGGVINVHTEFYGNYNAELAHQQVENIYTTCLTILQQSAQDNIPTQEAAIRLAEQRIQSVKNARLA